MTRKVREACGPPGDTEFNRYQDYESTCAVDSDTYTYAHGRGAVALAILRSDSNFSDQTPASAPEENSCKFSSTADLSSCQRASARDLPEFQTSSSLAFTWGSFNDEDFTRSAKQAYLEVVNRIPNFNVFAFPLGAVRKGPDSLKRHFFSLWALMLMPSLLLQQPAATSTHGYRQRMDCLQR